jgi:hypothetical protein
LYQYAVGRGLTAIAKQTGKVAWSLPEGTDLLAEAGTRAYVITKDRTLTVMDNAGQETVRGELRPGDQPRGQYHRCTDLSHGRHRPGDLS